MIRERGNGSVPPIAVRSVSGVTIREIEINDIGLTTKWAPLFRELRLRLERTGEHLALEVTFPDARTANLARHAIGKLFTKRHGRGYVKIAVRGNVFYIRRGPNYTK